MGPLRDLLVDLGYLAYSHRAVPREQVRLLGEILAMDRSDHSHHYLPTSHSIQLESITSKRIWELLADARSLGMPLVEAGKQSRPVTLHREAAEFALDLGRSADGLVLRPQVSVGDGQPVLAASRLLGSPAHGIAWWQETTQAAPTSTRTLRLGRLATRSTTRCAGSCTSSHCGSAAR